MFNWIPELIDNLQQKENERQRKSTEEPAPEPNHDSWQKFPLGFALDNTEIFWDPYESAHLYVFGQHANMLSANLVRHCAKHPDSWMTYVVDYNGVNVPRTKEFDSEEIEYLRTVEETHEAIRYLQEEMHLRLQHLRSWKYDSLLEQSNPLKSVLAIITVPHWIFVPTGIKTDEGVNLDELRVEMNAMVDDILRNGPKAGVHLAIMDDHTQIKHYQDKINHIATKVLIGHAEPEIASQILEHYEVNDLDISVRGRGYYQVNNEGKLFNANKYSAYRNAV